jgi:hypothetical protein
MRVTTTYNGVDEGVEKRRIFVFYVPISIYNLLILDSRSSLFHNYRIWPWAFGPMGYPWAGQALYKSLHKPRPADHCRVRVVPGED